MSKHDEIKAGLNNALSDAVVFWYKLHHHHWLVRGERFFELHNKFEELYNQWADHLDELAERVIAIGGTPISTLAGVQASASIVDGDGSTDPTSLVRSTVADLEAQHESLGKVIEHAESASDRGTVNMLDAIRDQIEGDVWMLKAYLGK